MTYKISTVFDRSRAARIILLAGLGLSVIPSVSSAKDAYWRVGINSFTCTGLETEPPQKDDRDPVYRIDVQLEVDRENRVVSISSTHMTVFGRTFRRTDQYPIEKIENLDAPTDIMWTGRYRKDPSIVLYSMMDKSPSNKIWFYHEGQFKNDKQRSNLTAYCSAT